MIVKPADLMRLSGDPKGYYRALGVARNASTDEIKAAFREKAKELHPDKAGPQADLEEFALLSEAYDVLRDPQKRLEYDAAGLTESPGAQRTRGSASNHRRDRAYRSTIKGRARRSRGSLYRAPAIRLALPWTIAIVTTLAAIGALGLWWSADRQLAMRQAQLAELYRRLEAAVQQQADTTTRYRATTFTNLDRALQHESSQSFLYQAELEFPPQVADLDEDLETELRRSVVEIARIADEIPSGRDWLILVEGYAGRAAGPEGVAVMEWELALLRMGVIVDYLVEQGLPTERLATRFSAGFAEGTTAGSGPQTLEIRLLCCFR